MGLVRVSEVGWVRVKIWSKIKGIYSLILLGWNCPHGAGDLVANSNKRETPIFFAGDVDVDATSVFTSWKHWNRGDFYSQVSVILVSLGPRYIAK